MRLEELKVGYHYYISDTSYHMYDGDISTYSEEYKNILSEALKLIGMGGEYPTLSRDVQPNNVKLLHEKTGIIIFSHCACLSKTKTKSNNFWEWEYKYNDYHNDQALSSNSIAAKYDYQRKVAFNVAKEKEFKLERIDNKQKARLIIAKLEMLIDETLKDINDVNGRKFLRYTKWLNLIKNKYNL